MRISLLLVALVFAGCASSNISRDLGRMESRNRTVAMKSTADGVRYTVTDRRGVVVGKDLSLSQLQATDPHTAQLVRGGIAVDANVSVGRNWGARE